MRIQRLLLFVGILTLSSAIYAKLPENVRQQIEAEYAAAVWHRGLESAQEPVDWSLVRDFAVLEVGAIPAEKAFWYITNQDYEYRSSVVDLGKDSLKTRRGKVYTYLDAGTVMIVSAVKISGNRIFVKLLTPEIFSPPARHEKRPSRVGAVLEFKVPKAQRDDGAAIVTALQSWIKPFETRAAAEAYAKTLLDASQ